MSLVFIVSSLWFCMHMYMCMYSGHGYTTIRPLLFQQCPPCLVRFIWMVLEMGSRWPWNCCFMGCSFQDFFTMVRSILVLFPSSVFSAHMVHPYRRIDITAARKKINCATSVGKNNWINTLRRCPPFYST